MVGDARHQSSTFSYPFGSSVQLISICFPCRNKHCIRIMHKLKSLCIKKITCMVQELLIAHSLDF